MSINGPTWSVLFTDMAIGAAGEVGGHALGMALGGAVRATRTVATNAIASSKKIVDDIAEGASRNAPGSGVAQVGRRGGEVYTKLDQLERRLAGWGIKLERNADNYLDATGLADGKMYGAMFEGSVKEKGTFYLRADASRYEVLHELSHVLDFRKGPNAWVNAASNDTLANLRREQAVFNRLRNSRSWDY